MLQRSRAIGGAVHGEDQALSPNDARPDNFFHCLFNIACAATSRLLKSLQYGNQEVRLVLG